VKRDVWVGGERRLVNAFSHSKNTHFHLLIPAFHCPFKLPFMLWRLRVCLMLAALLLGVAPRVMWAACCHASPSRVCHMAKGRACCRRGNGVALSSAPVALCPVEGSGAFFVVVRRAIYTSERRHLILHVVQKANRVFRFVPVQSQCLDLRVQCENFVGLSAFLKPPSQGEEGGGTVGISPAQTRKARI